MVTAVDPAVTAELCRQYITSADRPKRLISMPKEICLYNDLLKLKERLEEMLKNGSKLIREKETIRAMIEIYCRGLHSSQTHPCSDCLRLLDYALRRIDQCPFVGGKPACSKCPIHCYQPAVREEIKSVMRYSGPRMLLHHPVLALRHLLDGLKKAPGRDSLRKRKNPKT